MDANQIEKLKALALAATPGPWKWWTSNSHTRLSARGDGDVMYGETLYDGVNNIRVGHADAKFIEASNPAAVLELIAEVERLGEKVKTRDALLRSLNAVAIERGDRFGACDCIDNRGNPYPSQHFTDVLREGAVIKAHTKAGKDSA